MVYGGRRYGIQPDVLVDLGLASLIGGIIGARLLYVALDWNQFSAAPLTIFKVWEGGLSFHGGLAVGVLAVYLLCRWRGIRFGSLMDAGAPALSLAYAFARIGCFLNGCCFGGHCDSFWGVRFAPGSEAAAWSLGLPPGQPATTCGTPLYPTQLLDCALAIIVFFLLLALRPVFKRRGHLFVAFIGLYGVQRFVVEFWRHGASGRPFPGVPALTWAQMASIAMTVAAAAFLAATWPRRGQAGNSDYDASPRPSPEPGEASERKPRAAISGGKPKGKRK
jgi:phosphatidylglycerol:prolipoprotein diacylglycerol transferase